MPDKSSTTIRNSVIASLITLAIVSAVQPLRDYAISFLKWLWSGVTWLTDVIVASYALPGWLWIIVLFFAFIGLINIYQAVRPTTMEEHQSYTEDNIYGAIWRWHWVGNSISNLWCFCPNCEATLVYNDKSVREYLREPKTEFFCENCNRVIATVSGGDKEYALSATKREIDRRIRTNAFKKHQQIVQPDLFIRRAVSLCSV